MRYEKMNWMKRQEGTDPNRYGTFLCDLSGTAQDVLAIMLFVRSALEDGRTAEAEIVIEAGTSEPRNIEARLKKCLRLIKELEKRSARKAS